MMTRGVIAMFMPLMLMSFTGTLATVLGLLDRKEYGPLTLPFGLLCLAAAAVICRLMFKRTPHGWRKRTRSMIEAA
jgi:hypothetical protein